MQTCTCGHENSNDVFYCINCGRSLRQDLAVSREDRQNRVTLRRGLVCGNCGQAHLGNNINYCGNCGQSILTGGAL